MTIYEIKKDIFAHIGKNVLIKYNLGRNKYETYKVEILEMYDNIFLVSINPTKEIKSFSYSDVITKTIKIDY